MQNLRNELTIAHSIAETLIEGFDKHYRIFRDSSCHAKERFEQADWHGLLQTVKERVQFYDDRVNETAERLKNEFDANSLDNAEWQKVKLQFIDKLINHKQPELAETFFNSVCCKILHRTYFNNDYIFARPAISTEFIDSAPPVYTSYYPQESSLRETVKQIILDFEWQGKFEDLDRDINYIMRAAKERTVEWPRMEVNCQIQVLYSAFYRNKTAYIIGQMINGYDTYPFAAAVRHNDKKQLYIDTIIVDAWRISLLFSLSRAYFLVDMAVPSGYVQFLRSIMPNKPRSEIYTMLGLGKQGKTMFFRDLLSHLRHSNDKFIIAPGVPGLVMLVFTMPSFPYVFKIIKDIFGASKNMDRETVKRKYLMVKHVDRVGRMADTLEYSNAALPLSRFSEELLSELYKLAASNIEIDGDNLVIKHIYIERRMKPLNIYLENSDEESTEKAVREYGDAIRELAIANIFPGDMLWKNFGMTRYGRVVFYDYDEIEYMTDCNFRDIPVAPFEEMELSEEAWYSAAANDVFPEEFARFLLGRPEIRKAFMKHHKDLLSVKFWQNAQQSIRNGRVEDFFPYPQELRFIDRYGKSERSTETNEQSLANIEASPISNELE